MWKYLREICKKRKALLVFIILYLIIIIFVSNDAWLYQTPIARITHVETKESGTREAARGGTETCYTQTMEAVLLNGEWKGEEITLKNEYSYSQLVSQKYHKGDKVLLSTSGGEPSSTVKCLKRDTYVAALLGMLLLLLLLVTGKQGFYTICTVLVNLGIYVVGFSFYMNGKDIISICNILAVVFTLTTLVLLNGISFKTLAAVVSTFCVLALIMGLFHLTMEYGDFDYSSMEYLGNLSNPEDIFEAEILLAGLGAIMDVAVTISAAMGELTAKKPDITFRQLFHSGREVGYDIMGTMISVLLFTFGSGLLPTFLIRMNNEISFLTIVRLHIPFEICRFLLESIGIVAGIPVSILIASVLFKQKGRRAMKKK